MVFTPVFVAAAVVLILSGGRDPRRGRVQEIGRVYVILNAREVAAGRRKNKRQRFGVFTHRGPAKARKIFLPRGDGNSSYGVL
jgi:hypothetical protein